MLFFLLMSLVRYLLGNFMDVLVTCNGIETNIRKCALSFGGVHFYNKFFLEGRTKNTSLH